MNNKALIKDERCPISFKVFYDDLTRILNTQDI